MSAGADLLRIENLQVSFSLMGGTIDAVRGEPPHSSGKSNRIGR